MANEVVIDITANFKGNAYDKVKQLNQKLEELENHKNIDLNVSFENSKALSNLNNIQTACNKMESRMRKLENSQFGITLSVNVTDAERNINRITQKLSGITNRTANILVTTQGAERLSPSSLQTLVGGNRVITSAPSQNTGITPNLTTSSYSTIQRQMNKAGIISGEKSKIDSQKETTSDVIKGTITLAGSIAGTLASAVITPVGGAVVAGLASILGDFVGNGVGEAIYGSSKTPEEVFDQYINKSFGSISLSQSTLNSVATGMLAENKVPTNPNRFSMEQENVMQGNVNTSYSEITRQGEKIGLKLNHGMDISDNEYASYLNQSQGYASGAIDLVTQQWYDERNSTKDLLGENHPLVGKIDQKYSEALNGNSATGEAGLISIQKDLSDYIHRAISDNNFTPDEMAEVSGYIEKIHGYTQGLSPDQSNSEKGSFDFLLKNGMLDYDSFLGAISEMQGISDADVKTYADERQQIVGNNPDNNSIVSQANTQFYQKSGDSIAGTVDTGIDLFNEYSKNKFKKGRGSYQKSSKDYINSLYGRNNLIDPSGQILNDEMTSWSTPGVLSKRLGFNNLDPNYQKMARDVYDTMSNKQGALENTARKTVSSGGDASKQFQSLQSMYEVGAASGDSVATQKYWGSVIAGDSQLSELMEKQLAGPYGEANLNQDMVQAYKLFTSKAGSQPKFGAGLSMPGIFSNMIGIQPTWDSSTTAGLQQNPPPGTILGGGTQPLFSELFGNGLSASEDSITGALGEGLNFSEIDFGKLNIGTDLMSTIAEGLTESDIDFEGLGLGDSLIGKIGEGLTSTEIDFSELGFGENLMTALATGLTDSEIDFEGLGLGESLISTIGEGLTDTEIDFSEMGFGENLMTALVAGLTESDIDFEGLGLGESLMSLIGEGLTDTEIDFSEMGFGENLISALVAGLTESEIDFEGLGIGETIMSMLGESLSAIDFSESGIGESMMASIANAFSSVSFEEMDLGGLGEGLSAAIASSLTELDLSSITEQFSLLSETPIQLEVVDNASPIIQGIQEPIQGLTEVDPNVNVAATDNASATISGIAGALANLKDKTVTVSVVTVGGPVPCAEGTMDAPGGLVMINDENTSDPRELIEHNGTYMMYEGRNVLTTLAPHDKVYTASQTKAIMEGMGIPRYERGKNNNIISSGGGIIPTSGSGSSGSGVAVGGVNLSINVSGGDADVIDQIKKRGEEVAEYIAGTISSRLSDAYANTPVATE